MLNEILYLTCVSYKMMIYQQQQQDNLTRDRFYSKNDPI